MNKRSAENLQRLEALAEIRAERRRIALNNIARLTEERDALLQKLQWKQASIKEERQALKSLAGPLFQ